MPPGEGRQGARRRRAIVARPNESGSRQQPVASSHHMRWLLVKSCDLGPLCGSQREFRTRCAPTRIAVPGARSAPEKYW